MSERGLKDVPGERIAKVLARAGVCSRRDAEKLVAEGQVKVNGKVLDTPAWKVKPTDKIEVNGKLVEEKSDTRLWRYHKKSGTVTTHKDPEGRPTVFEELPDDLPRVISVGRLDLTSEGLLLLTNDGELARKLELPSTGWLRRYRARVYGRISERDLEKLTKGIRIDGVIYKAHEASIERQQGGNTWVMISLKEGKNREIRKLFESIDCKVNRLIRISYGPFQLGALKAGEVDLVPNRVLREQVGGEFSKNKSNDNKRRSPKAKPGTKPTKPPQKDSVKKHTDRLDPDTPTSAVADKSPWDKG